MGKRFDEDYTEAFGDQCRKDVLEILSIPDDETFSHFWTRLRDECLKVRRGVETSPNGFRLEQVFSRPFTLGLQSLFLPQPVLQ